MTNLDTAISQLQEESDAYTQGSKVQPRDGTTEWYVLRAITIGLGYLKRAKQLGLEDDVPAADRLYRAAAKASKGVFDEVSA